MHSVLGPFPAVCVLGVLCEALALTRLQNPKPRTCWGPEGCHTKGWLNRTPEGPGRCSCLWWPPGRAVDSRLRAAWPCSALGRGRDQARGDRAADSRGRPCALSPRSVRGGGPGGGLSTTDRGPSRQEAPGPGCLLLASWPAAVAATGGAGPLTGWRLGQRRLLNRLCHLQPVRPPAASSPSPEAPHDAARWCSPTANSWGDFVERVHRERVRTGSSVGTDGTWGRPLAGTSPHLALSRRLLPRTPACPPRASHPHPVSLSLLVCHPDVSFQALAEATGHPSLTVPSAAGRFSLLSRTPLWRQGFRASGVCLRATPGCPSWNIFLI